MQRNLNVILNVLAGSYEVNVKVNGVDVGILGCKAESVKLFNKSNPMADVLPPDMQNTVCLKEGENSIELKFKRIKDADPDELTIEIQAREQFVNGANLFAHKEKLPIGESKEITEFFTL